MALLAGEVITAARLLHDSDGTTLSLLNPTTSFDDWGTETVTFTDPGVEVKVTGRVTGQASHPDSADIFVQTRVGISFDGGSTFEFGPEPASQVAEATGAARRQHVVASAHRTGTPTGDVVVKAQAAEESSQNTVMVQGFLEAAIHAT